MSTVSVNGIRVAYDDVGAGENVIVLVHGHPFNRSMWTSQIDALGREGWRVIAPDLRGYGETTVVPGKTTLDIFAGDIAALLDQLGIGQVALCGLSMGGQIVMEFARLYRVRLRAVVLVGTFPQAETADGRQQRHMMADRLLREGMSTYAREVLPRMLAPRSVIALPAVAAAVLRMMETTPPEGAAAGLRGRAERPSYEEVLKTVKLPTLVVAGDEDAFTTRADADLMNALVEGSSLAWMRGVGHLPNLENPAAFNDALLDFLDSLPDMD